MYQAYSAEQKSQPQNAVLVLFNLTQKIQSNNLTPA